MLISATSTHSGIPAAAIQSHSKPLHQQPACNPSHIHLPETLYPIGHFIFSPFTCSKYQIFRSYLSNSKAVFTPQRCSKHTARRSKDAHTSRVASVERKRHLNKNGSSFDGGSRAIYLPARREDCPVLGVEFTPLLEVDLEVDLEPRKAFRPSFISSMPSGSGVSRVQYDHPSERSPTKRDVDYNLILSLFSYLFGSANGNKIALGILNYRFLPRFLFPP